MSKKKTEEKPLVLFQPPNVLSKGNMQNTYSVKKSKQEKHQELLEKKLKEELIQEVKESRKNKDSSPKETVEKNSSVNKITPSDIQSQIQDYNVKQIEENQLISQQKPSFRRLKSFKEMDIEEKLIYLLNFPKQLPPVPCIIMTDSMNVRGFVVDKDESSVQLKLMDESSVSISLSTIEEVKMIGL